MENKNLEQEIKLTEKAIKRQGLVDLVTAWWNAGKITFGGVGLGYTLIQNYMNVTNRVVAGYKGHEILADSMLITIMLGSAYLIGSGLEGIAEWHSKYNFISHKEYQKDRAK